MFPNLKSDKPLHKYTLTEKDRVKIKAQEVILVIIYNFDEPRTVSY